MARRPPATLLIYIHSLRITVSLNPVHSAGLLLSLKDDEELDLSARALGLICIQYTGTARPRLDYTRPANDATGPSLCPLSVHIH